MKRKSAFIFLSVVLCLLAFSMPIVASAANVKETIPAHMKPGTVIQYDKNNIMIIIQDGYAQAAKNNNAFAAPSEPAEVEKAIQEAIKEGKIVYGPTDEKISFPAPVPGMRVAYDGTGNPAIITGGPQTVTPNSAPDLVGQVIYGNFSWFTDYMGQQNHVLKDFDCATKMGFDEPPCGTTVYTRDLTTWNPATLSKWDIGSLPNCVLDVRPYVFQYVYGEPLGNGHLYGRYIHYQ